MAKYSDIKGFTVQTLSTDPIESTPPTGAWSSGGSLNDAKPYGFGSGGVQTAAISFGGGLANDTTNENYNGTSWTENSAMNNGYSYATGTGSQTDAIAINGLTTPPLSVKNATEEWNGSSWTAGGNTNTARYNIGNQAFGPGTASAFVGGRGPDYQPKMLHEQYNGSSWTETTDTPTDIFDGASSGVQTNAILASGNHTKQPPGTSTSDGKTITWDGSSWTEITAYSTARTSAVGTGVYNDFLYIGGYTGTAHVALTEKWNGSSWTEIADMGTGKNSIGGGKTESDSTSSIVFGGSPTPSGAPTQTEEFSVAPPTASIITEGQLYFNSTTNTFKETITDVAGGTWASGGSLPAAKWIGNSAGTQTSNLFAGGATDAPATPNITATSYEYNGTSWTAGGDMNESRIAGAGFGASNTAAVVAVGNEPTLSAKTETYNGTAFTEVADANQARGERVGGGGTSTAGVIFGGANPPSTMKGETEIWDGSSWTETGDLNTARMQLGSSGIAYTASIAFGGYDTTGTAKTETFNGSTWTETGDLNTAREGLGGSGTSTAALAFSGLTPPGAKVGATENFDGSTWTELADLSTTRYLVGGSPSGTNISAIAAGGLVTEAVTNTEEWTASLANKTITSS